ncbi:MAG: hypothetical protein VB100_04575 [Angelakisella sp.]|nr:hypothetical protein [Angelakisella sp.]
MTRKKIAKKKLLYVCLIICFIIMLFASNYFVMHMTSDYHLKEDSLTNYSYKNEVYFALDKKSKSNIWGKSQIGGWAFCTSNSQNENRLLTFLFKSPNQTYSLQTTYLIDRQAVLDDYKKIGIVMTNPIIGYDRDFSTINMKQGIYQLYVYCYENEQDYGLTKTNYFFEKKGTSFAPYEWKSKIVEAKTVVTPNENAVAILDVAKIKGECLELTGWAIIQGEDSSNQVVYAKVTGNGLGKTFNTLDYRRISIADAYSDERYADCGYTALIPLDNIDNGLLTVEIIVENNGQIGVSKTYTIRKDSSSVEIV